MKTPPLPQPYFCALLATHVHYTQWPQPHTVRVHRQQPGDSLPRVSSFSPRVGKQLIRSMVLSHPFCHKVTQETQSIGRESKVDLSLGREGSVFPTEALEGGEGVHTRCFKCLGNGGVRKHPGMLSRYDLFWEGIFDLWLAGSMGVRLECVEG